MTEKILLVDDEPHVLEGYRRQLRRHFVVETACGAQAALTALAQQGPFAVIVSDMRMPGIDGAELLKRVRVSAPMTVRLMLTGAADIITAMKAVNQGSIFRFLTKPCAPEALAEALTAAVEQHRLITAEKTLIEKTLSGAVKLLTEVLSLSAPGAFSRAKRVQELVRKLIQHVKFEQPWQVELAAMLSQIGCIAVPPDVLERHEAGGELSADEQQMVDNAPTVSGKLVAHIPRLEKVTETLTHLGTLCVGRELAGEEAPHRAARLLRVACAFDLLVQRGITPASALPELRARLSRDCAEALGALAEVVGEEEPFERRQVEVDELMTGMVLVEDLRTVSGQLLVARGNTVSMALRERLANYILRSQLKGNVEVLVPIEPKAPRPPAPAAISAVPAGST